MTSDRTDEQILKDPSGQPSVEQHVGSTGGHDRLNEAPRTHVEYVPIVFSTEPRLVRIVTTETRHVFA